MMNIKWYVLYVNTGQEHAVAEQLRYRGYDAIVPVENKLIRSKASGQPNRIYFLTAMYLSVWTMSGQSIMYSKVFHTLSDYSAAVQVLFL